MAHATTSGRCRQVGQRQQQLAQEPRLPFANLLDRDLVQEALRAEKVSFRDRLFSPLVTLWVFLSQVLDAALGRYQGKQTGETSLWHTLYDNLELGDIVLADRYFGSFWELALVRQRGADLVSRLHQRRKADFRCGLRLGKDDHVVDWS